MLACPEPGKLGVMIGTLRAEHSQFIPVRARILHGNERGERMEDPKALLACDSQMGFWIR